MSNRRFTLLRRGIRRTHGAIDLASIIVGVVVVAILGTVIGAAVLASIPWAQDNAAKQTLNSVRIAEENAHTRENTYLDDTKLAAGGYYTGKASSLINAVGNCFIAAAKSDSGKIFWINSADFTARGYAAGDTSTCANLPRLIDKVNGIAPGNDVSLSYASTAFDPSKSGQQRTPTPVGGDNNYTYTIDTDLTATGITFDKSTGIFTGPAKWSFPFDSVSTSYYSNCGTAAGTVWCWGRNDSGQSGQGAKNNTPTAIPMQVSGLLDGKYATAVSVGEAHACAVADADLYCWGDGANGDLGQGNTNPSYTPIKVGGALAGKKVTAVAAGKSYTCAVADKALYCWGVNTSGQVGIGSVVSPQLSPVAVTGLGAAVITGVTTGETHACAIADGKAYCWGANANGQLGNGTQTASTAPVAVIGAPAAGGVTAIDGGEGHTCAIANGAAYCWGINTNGQLGIGTTASPQTSPVAVSGITTGATSISAGRYFSCAVANGTAFCWGFGSYGNLGNNTLAPSYAPATAGSGYTSVTASDYAACGVRTDNTLNCWGYNSFNQLGVTGGTITTATKQQTPLLVSGTGKNNGLPIDATVTVTSDGFTATSKVTLRVGVK